MRIAARAHSENGETTVGKTQFVKWSTTMGLIQSDGPRSNKHMLGEEQKAAMLIEHRVKTCRQYMCTARECFVWLQCCCPKLTRSKRLRLHGGGTDEPEQRNCIFFIHPDETWRRCWDLVCRLRDSAEGWL